LFGRLHLWGVNIIREGFRTKGEREDRTFTLRQKGGGTGKTKENKKMGLEREGDYVNQSTGNQVTN